MKTILEITPNFPGEVFINRHVESLIQLDYPIQVLTRQTAKKNLESASIAGKLEFSFKPKIFPKFQNLSPLDMLIILKQLVQLKNFPYSKSLFRDRVYLEYIKRLNPALIHFHFGSLAAFMNWMPQELGIPYTLSLRGSDIQVIPLLSEKNAKLFQEGINNAVGIHTVSDSLWKLAEPYLNHTIYHKTIYTTVPFVENLIARDGGDRGSEVIFVTVGRLHWIKNYVDLLKAFRRLLDTGLNAKLVIIGDGSEKECLIYWVSILGLQNNIIFKGKLNYDGVSEILKHSTGYIQSSIAEGLSNATAEAMAVGLPVFATDVGGTGEIIQDGVNGFLLDPFQPDEWYKKLSNVKNIPLMESISVRGWQTAKDKFSQSIHANAFISFYEHVLNNLN